MATEYALQCVSKSAGADLSADQYKIVAIGAGEVVTVAATKGVLAFGVLQNDPIAGQPASVAIGGQTKIKLGATLAVSAKFTTSAAGLAIAPVATDIVLGTITEGGDNGTIGSALFNPSHATPA